MVADNRLKQISYKSDRFDLSPSSVEREAERFFYDDFQTSPSDSGFQR